jgi:FAD:protein FMN transferase
VPETPPDGAPRLRHVEHVMGTVFSFDLRPGTRHPHPASVPRALREAVGWLHHVDHVFSTYRADSAISRLARDAVPLGELPQDVPAVLDLCEQARQQTHGCFSARSAGQLDPSGLVKGWAVEKAADILRAAGVRSASVNGGGDIQLVGEASPGTPWRVGITDPRRPRHLLAVAAARDMAVATSGIAERGMHITDPRTGRPARGLLAATVTGPRLTWADAYATAAVVMGPPALRWIETVPGYEMLAVAPDGTPIASPAFPHATAAPTAPDGSGVTLSSPR